MAGLTRFQRVLFTVCTLNEALFIALYLCKNLQLVATYATDLASVRGAIRMAVTPKDQYVAQCARGAYIATVSQPEAAFDLSFAAQVINLKEEHAEQLNKRL